jgi:hypothetical protein
MLFSTTGSLIASLNILPAPWGLLGIIPAIWIYSRITGNTIVETVVLLMFSLILCLIISGAVRRIREAFQEEKAVPPPKAVFVPEELLEELPEELNVEENAAMP